MLESLRQDNMNNGRQTGFLDDHSKVIKRIISITVDSGATKRVVNDHKLFKKVETIAPDTVLSADGSEGAAKYRWQVEAYKFGKNLVLRTVSDTKPAV